MKVHRILLFALVLALMAYATGCKSMWQTTKSVAFPTIGAVLGAALGTVLGPAGTILGGGIGAATGDLFEENASLRSGETVGEVALKKQLVNMSIAYGNEKAAKIEAQTGEWMAQNWKRWIVYIAIGFFVFLRRQWIWKTITGQGVRSRFWTFIHALVSGNKTRELAIGFDPLPKNLPSQADKDVIVARLEKSA